VTRPQVRALSRLLGALVLGVCCVLVLPWAHAGTSAAKASPPPPQAPAADAAADVPPGFAGPAAPLSGTGVAFDGLPAVGALFPTDAAGHRTRHHSCTATVVASAVGNVVATAAHCLSDPAQGLPASSTASLVFVPGYHDGIEPYGEWAVTRALVDPHWAATGDPDDDVAFVLVQRVGDPGARLADLVGAEAVGFSRPRPVAVGAVGYPTATEKPVACHNTLKVYSATQSEFDCTGFASGSSGGPMLTGIDPRTGRGTLVGVIGGYQQGGYTPDISYSCYFGDAVKALYELAVAAARAPAA
jgi:V8-like Glu-specific endopeptidase